MDYILNGIASGNVAKRLLDSNFDIGTLRPFIGKDCGDYITRNEGGKLTTIPVQNANATLRRDEWKIIDDVILPAAKANLRLVSDIRGAGLTLNVPNGMSKTVLETSTLSEITPATISMDPARQGESDRPEVALGSLPLPVIHKDFFYTAREIATARQSGLLDTTMPQLAAEAVALEAEKLAIGIAGTFTYGGGSIYGLTNFPQRITSVNVTTPPDSPWSPATMVQEVLAMRQASVDAFYRGPWVLYNSPGWNVVLDDDYSQAKGDNTLRERLARIEGITAIRTLDYLSDYQLILVQMTQSVIREVVGMDITTVQWETMGGMIQNFKVMAILVPQLRADFNGNTGIVHAVA